MHKFISKLYDEFTKDECDRFSDYLVKNISSLNASWHPLGFVVVKLFEDSSYKYRLHIWPKDHRRPKEPDWQIHNHIFDLESLVLSGRIGSRDYRVIESKMNENSDYVKYSVNYQHSGSKIVITDCVLDVKLEAERFMATGEKYQIKRGEFHQSCVDKNEFAASLVRTSNEGAHGSPAVVGLKGHNDVYDCPNQKLQRKHLKNLISLIHS